MDEVSCDMLLSNFLTILFSPTTALLSVDEPSNSACAGEVSGLGRVRIRLPVDDNARAWWWRVNATFDPTKRSAAASVTAADRSVTLSIEALHSKPGQK